MPGNTNPWKAFLPYDEKSSRQFKGRDKNIEELFNLVLQEKTTVCYADSGIGKSSLINAGLKPRLRQHLFFPVDVVFTEADFASKSLDFDRFLIQCLEKEIEEYNEINEAVQFAPVKTIDVQDGLVAMDEELSRSSLWWYLHTRKISCSILGNHTADYSPIFIFDQFEELFTRSQSEEMIKSFFEWFPVILSDAFPKEVEKELEGKDNWTLSAALTKKMQTKFIFSLRQDSMGTFDYWTTQRFSIPSLRRNRYCLLPLTSEQARCVIIEQGVDTLDGVSEEIIEELRESSSDSVPAIMLSVFCYKLYENAKVGDDGIKQKVNKEDISTNKETLIREYYEELLKETKIDKNTVFVIEDCLVSETGKRNRIVNGSSEKLNEIHFDEKYRKVLSDKYLISDRKEYVEIAHDKLGEAIFARKKERKLNRNLRKWRFLSFVFPFLLLAVSIGYTLVPSKSIQRYLSHEIVIDENEYVKWERFYNHSQYKNLLIDSAISNNVVGYPYLQKVKIKNIEEIEFGFKDCKNLEQIEILDSVTRIGVNFIQDCPQIKILKISKGVKEINPNALQADELTVELDSANTRLVWDNGILWDTEAGRYGYPIVYIQENILSVTNRLPFIDRFKNVDSIEYRGTFVYPQEEHPTTILVNRDSTELLPSNAYKLYRTVDLSLFKKVETIPDGLFKDCNKLEKVLLPPGLYEVGDEAFSGCSQLKEIEFPKYLGRIGARAFESCSNLKKISFDNSSEYARVYIGEYAFSYCDSLKELALPEEMYPLSWAAFSDCKALETVYLPRNVLVPENYWFGAVAFLRCDNLKEFKYYRGIKNENGQPFVIREGMPFLNGHLIGGLNKRYDYKDNSYHSRNGIIYDEKDHVVCWNQHSSFEEYGPKKYLDLFGSSYYWCLVLDSSSVVSLPEIYHRIEFVKLPEHLKELHLKNPQPDVLKRNRSGIYSDRIQINLPRSIKRNVILYVPYGCGKYYVNHPDYRDYKEIREDTFGQRCYDIVESRIAAIVSYYQGEPLAMSLSCIGLVVLCCLVFLLNKSMDRVWGIKRNNRKTIGYSILFTIPFAVICFMGAYWLFFVCFDMDNVWSSVWGCVFCLVGVSFLALMQRVTPSELWHKRAELWRHLVELLINKRRIILSSLLLLIVWSVFGWCYGAYDTRLEKYRAHVLQICEDSRSTNVQKSYSYAYESLTKTSFLKFIEFKDVKTLRGHSGYVSSASFSRDGKYLVTASGDNTAMLWRVGDDRVAAIDTLRGHSRYVNSASFSRDGKYLVTASGDNTAMLWRVGDDRVAAIDTLRGHSGSVTSASFSPDGKYIVTASDDKTAMLWRVEEARVAAIDTLCGHSGYVNSASFSPDGKYIVTASWDNTVMLWRVGKARVSAIDTLRGHRYNVRSASFSPDGKYIVTASGDNTARLWIIDRSRLIKHHRYLVKKEPLSEEQRKEYGIKWWMKW